VLIVHGLQTSAEEAAAAEARRAAALERAGASGAAGQSREGGVPPALSMPVCACPLARLPCLSMAHPQAAPPRSTHSSMKAHRPCWCKQSLRQTDQWMVASS